VMSGKTTFINRLMNETDKEERLITVEDSAEFRDFGHRNRVSLFFGSANVSCRTAVETTLRMRPDRVAIQELRGGEAFAMLRLLAAGYRGCLTTWHGNRNDPFTPLALMIKSTPEGQTIPDDKLMVTLRGLIDIVVFCQRDGGKFSVPYIWYRDAEEQR
jgi:type IV secretion system protein VirB11